MTTTRRNRRPASATSAVDTQHPADRPAAAPHRHPTSR